AGADVELGPHGQGDGAPVSMLGQGSGGDPDVAGDVLLPGGGGGRGGGGATGPAGGAKAGGGGGGGGQQQTPFAQQRPDAGLDGDGEVVGPSADGADGGVAVAVAGGDAGRSEPGGNGAAAFGEEDAAKQQGQAGGGVPVQPVGQVGEGAG